MYIREKDNKSKLNNMNGVKIRHNSVENIHVYVIKVYIMTLLYILDTWVCLTINKVKLIKSQKGVFPLTIELYSKGEFLCHI